MKVMSFREAMMRTVVCVVTLSAVTAFGAATSENNQRLKDALKKYPAADIDKDGVLTAKEALAYRAKALRGEKSGQPTLLLFNL